MSRENSARGGEHVLQAGEVELLEQRDLGCRDDDGDRGAGIAGHRRIPLATIRAASDTVPAHALTDQTRSAKPIPRLRLRAGGRSGSVSWTSRRAAIAAAGASRA